MGGSVIFALKFIPSGKTAVDAPYAVAVRTPAFWCGNEHGARFVAVQAAQAIAMTAGREFINRFRTHASSSSRYRASASISSAAD